MIFEGLPLILGGGNFCSIIINFQDFFWISNPPFLDFFLGWNLLLCFHDYQILISIIHVCKNTHTGIKGKKKWKTNIIRKKGSMNFNWWIEEAYVYGDFFFLRLKSKLGRVPVWFRIENWEIIFYNSFWLSLFCISQNSATSFYFVLWLLFFVGFFFFF